MSIKDIIFESIDKQGIAILPSMDVFDSINLLKTEQIHIACTMLDPWYNKGKGNVLPTDEYDAFRMTKNVSLWPLYSYINTACDLL